MQGTKVGRYEVVGQLATGGMAEILLARLVGPSGFERLVVLKRMLPHLGKVAAAREMFLDEARILAGIRHTNVVQVEELSADNGEPFLAMEYLDGENAAGLMRRIVAQRRRLPADLAAHIIAEACAGLHAAHELRAPDGTSRGLVHRDVSPQNLFITYDGAVKVLDFGIAKANDRVTRTETGQLKGKFQYMSPEQTKGEALDRRSDIFSLGVVLYELATGRSLFHRRTHLLTMKAICEEPITPPSRVATQVPKGLDPICVRSMKRAREDRYPTALAMRKELLPLSQLSGADEPRERLAALMRELFPDRIAEKGEMVRQVRSGTSITAIPGGDVDELVTVPSVLEVVRPSDRTASRRVWIAILAAAGVIGGVVPFVRRKPEPVVDAPALSTVPVLASGSSVTPAVSVGEPDERPPQSTITLTVHSTPPGARVLVNSEEQATTPGLVQVPRGTAPIRIEIEKNGFVSAQKRLVPEADQEIDVVLVRERRGAPPPPPAKHPKTPVPSGSFERFD